MSAGGPAAQPSPGHDPTCDPEPARIHGLVRGMTVSCQTNGREWGTPAFAQELRRLATLGVNWIAIHPYAGIAPDGTVSWRAFDPSDPPAHLAGAIEAAHAAGLSILVKPHLAYWGSPFEWRGAIRFDGADERARFRETYAEWTRELAAVCSDADGFSVGCELDGFQAARDELFWRALIEDVRARTEAHLTYAANWSTFEQVRFWDALDCIGVQAYFPLLEAPRTDAGELAPVDAEWRAALRAAWDPWIDRLARLHARTGKPVVFTELGYDALPGAPSEPWLGRGGHGHRSAPPARRELHLQAMCLDVALERLERESEWLRGPFLWKWFAGPAPGADFLLDTAQLRALLTARWTTGAGAPE